MAGKRNRTGRLPAWLKLWLVAAATATLGVSWLIMSAGWSGGSLDLGAGVFALPWLLVGFLVGMAIRPRTTLQGELRVASELGAAVLGGIFVPAATVFAAYLGFALVSVVAVALLWFAWGAGMTLAFVVQVTVYLSLVLGGLAVIFGIASQSEQALAAGGLSVATGGVLVGLVTLCFGDASAAFDFGALRYVQGLSRGIPGWMFLEGWFRELASGIDHARIASHVAAQAMGLTAALLVCGISRVARQQLMRRAELRPYLPFAAAPVPDGQAVVSPRQLWVMLGAAAGVWGGLEIWWGL